MGRIFIDKRVWRKSRDHWVSFESDPRLRVTKENIYGRCVPCMAGLYEQLQNGKEVIELREAFQCWKVIAVLADQEECFQVLSLYEDQFLGDRMVKGKFGSSLPSQSSKVLMFHAESEKERDRLFEELRSCARGVNAEARVFYQRACTNLYHDLLGDWRDWKETTPIKDLSFRPIVMERIKRLLYWEKG